MHSILLAVAVSLGCAAKGSWTDPSRVPPPVTDRTSFLFAERPFQVRRMDFSSGSPTVVDQLGWGLRYKGTSSVRHVWLLDSGNLPSYGAAGAYRLEPNQGLVIGPVSKRDTGRQKIPQAWRKDTVGRGEFRKQMRLNWLSGGLGNLQRQGWVESRVTSQRANQPLTLLDPTSLLVAATGLRPGQRAGNAALPTPPGSRDWVGVSTPAGEAFGAGATRGSVRQINPGVLGVYRGATLAKAEMVGVVGIIESPVTNLDPKRIATELGDTVAVLPQPSTSPSLAVLRQEVWLLNDDFFDHAPPGKDQTAVEEMTLGLTTAPAPPADLKTWLKDVLNSGVTVPDGSGTALVEFDADQCTVIKVDAFLWSYPPEKDN